MRIIKHDTTRQLLGVISPRSPFGARDHALIRLFTHTGLRVAEITGLDVGHVFDQAPRHWLDLPASICKGNRSRRIPLSGTARQAIQDNERPLSQLFPELPNVMLDP